MQGLSYNNPIWYRGYRIYHTSFQLGAKYTYQHDDFDGAIDAYDFRYGYCNSIEECKAEIDELEDDA